MFDAHQKATAAWAPKVKEAEVMEVVEEEKVGEEEEKDEDRGEDDSEEESGSDEEKSDEEEKKIVKRVRAKPAKGPKDLSKANDAGIRKIRLGTFEDTGKCKGFVLPPRSPSSPLTSSGADGLSSTSTFPRCAPAPSSTSGTTCSTAALSSSSTPAPKPFVEAASERAPQSRPEDPELVEEEGAERGADVVEVGWLGARVGSGTTEMLARRRGSLSRGITTRRRVRRRRGASLASVLMRAGGGGGERRGVGIGGGEAKGEDARNRGRRWRVRRGLARRLSRVRGGRLRSDEGGIRAGFIGIRSRCSLGLLGWTSNKYRFN